MKTTELILCKTVTTESFPDRGWIGLVVPGEHGKELAGLYTRSELYREVKAIMSKYGEETVRLTVSKFSVPEGYQLMFAPSRDAFDGTHARSLIEKHMRG
jgi:hypothetical protein